MSTGAAQPAAGMLSIKPLTQTPQAAGAELPAGPDTDDPDRGQSTWRERGEVILNSYSEIFFLKGPVAGVLLLLVTMINLNVGIAGLLSVLSAFLFARLIGMERSFLASGFFTYNALLVGLSVGYLFALAPLTLFLVAAAGVFSFIVSVMLNSIFSYYLKLPILSLPFVLVSSVTWLASQGYGGLYVSGVYVHDVLMMPMFPAWLEGFLVTLGAILFTPHPLAGLVIAGLILRHSRILLLLAVLGYYLGATLSWVLAGSSGAMFADINYFNYILIAMALGGIYLVPSPRGYLVMAAAIAVATLLMAAVRLFGANYGLPVFTLPFNLVTLALLYVLGVIGFPLVARQIRNNPEATLDDYLSNARRFGDPAREIALPFSGVWTVWQGFDGPWTHRGSWQHAYDFVIDKAGKTHRGDGRQLEDYYAWGKSVMAPCRGRVVTVVANLPDNPPGHVDSQNNWGNLVIIETPQGWYVEISHFAQHSVRVQEGQWLEPGEMLGLCGNSGYSAQPHIHIQVQASAQIGAVTLPFRIKGYLQAGRFQPQGLPKTGARVEPLFPDRGLAFRTAFPLDSRFRYQLLDGQRELGEMDITVRMGPGGESYLDSGRGQLYFARDDHSFYFYRLDGDDPGLALMFAALPRMPLVYRHDMHWKDLLPQAAVTQGWRRHGMDLLRAVMPSAGQVRYYARWISGGKVRGVMRVNDSSNKQGVEAELHSRLGFSRLRVGERSLILMDNPQQAAPKPASISEPLTPKEAV